MTFTNDDSLYLEKAMQEYREQSWDDSNFEDLPRELQQSILARAQQIKSGYQLKKMVPAA